jgi:long-chain acyl-CoA synthetase
MEKPWLKFYDPGVPPEIEIPEAPLAKILDDAADEFPGHSAFFFFGGKITYAALRSYADQFARALAGIGFQSGQRVGIILPNMPQAVITFHGTLKAGGTVVYFDPLSEEEELERRVKDSGVEILVVLDLILPRVDPVFARTKVKQFIIATVKEFLPFPRNVLFSLGAKARGMDVKIAKKENVHPFQPFLVGAGPSGSGQAGNGEISNRPEELAVIQYAGENAQETRGVLLTHQNLLANLKQISSWMGASERGKEIVLSIAPFHEAYGMNLGMNLPLYLGAMSIQQPKFEEAQVLTALKKIRPTIFPALSFMIQPLTVADFRGRPGGLKVSWSMGGPIPVEVAERYEHQAGGRICECYGPEGSALTHANPLRGTRKAGSVGLPLPGTDARIVDAATGENEMPVGQSGELIVKGPQVTKGYWNRPAETGKAIRRGWLHTGDQARMDEDGFFFILGKIKK